MNRVRALSVWTLGVLLMVAHSQGVSIIRKDSVVVDVRETITDGDINSTEPSGNTGTGTTATSSPCAAAYFLLTFDMLSSPGWPTDFTG